jgi:hypothetical protein
LSLIFCGICVYMIYVCIEYAQAIHLLGGLFAVAGVLALAGLILYRVSRRMVRQRAPADEPATKSVPH